MKRLKSFDSAQDVPPFDSAQDVPPFDSAQDVPPSISSNLSSNNKIHRLKPDALRTTGHDPNVFKKIKRNPIYIIVDNVLDTYNVGAIFRLADAVAAEKVILCGQTETPPNTRIKKASINTTEWVPWEYAEDTVLVIQNLKSRIQNLQVVAIEQDERSIPFQEIEYSFPIALVVGHETHGVSKEVLDNCDKIVELPMYGINTSLNVMVSLGIILYQVVKFLSS